MAKNSTKVKYLIIGNSAGGIGAAEAIRSVDKTGSITIVSDEPYPAYSRPLISEHLADKYPLEKMLYRPANFYEQNNIRTILGKKAVKLDPIKHTVKLDDGTEIIGEKILLATGGLPITPEIKGMKMRGVFSFTTLDDARAIDQYLNQFSRRNARAVVIGGGLIGVSVTEALVKRGVSVTVVEMKDRVLNTILDKEASAVEAEMLQKYGVNIITGHTVTEITSYSGDMVTGVTLEDDAPIPCDIVIVAIVVRPRVEIVSGTAIKVNRGIVVDRNMQTSAADIYACGDTAEAYDFIYDDCRLTPIWPNAYLGGRTAGLNMAGKTTEYPGGTSLNSLKYFGLAIVSAGVVNPPDSSGYEILENKHNGNYHKVVLKDGLVKGMVFVGNIERSGIIFNLLREKIKVDSFKQALVADDFGLAYLPAELWAPKLRVPSGATASSPQPEPVAADAGAD